MASQPPRRVTLAATVLAACALVGLPTWSAAPREAATSGAARFAPPEAHREVLTSPDGRVELLETARTYGVAVFTAGPPGLLRAAAEDQTLAERTTWVRTNRTANEGEQGVWLMSLSGRGVVLHVVGEGERYLSYGAGRVLLPPDVAPGATWTDEGTMTAGDSDLSKGATAGYTAVSRAIEAPGAEERAAGCLAVTTEEHVTGLDPQSETLTWCPGRGVVALVTARRSLASAPGYPAAGDPRLSADATPPQLAEPTASWTLSPADGSSVPLSMTTVLPPVPLGAGRWALANHASRDVVGFDVARDALARRWVAHPGGDVTALGSSGEIVVAATTRRRLVAYDDAGRWLWEAEAPDIAHRAPQAFGAGLVVSGFANGEVGAYDARSGRWAWSVRVPGDRDPLLLVDGERLHAVAPTGEVTTLDRNGAAIATSSFGRPIGHAAVVGDHLVGLASDSPLLTALDSGTGRVAWRTAYQSSAATLLPLPGALVLHSEDDGLLCLDAATGATRWTRPGPVRAATSWAGGLLAAIGDVEILIGPDGREVARWTSGRRGTASRAWIVRGPDGLLVVDSQLGLTRGVPG